MTRKKPEKDKRKGKQRGGRPRKNVQVFDFAALKWDTIKHARQSMTALMVAFADGSLTDNKIRTVVYMSRALLAFLESERALVLDERFALIEQRLTEIEKAKGAGK